MRKPRTHLKALVALEQTMEDSVRQAIEENAYEVIIIIKGPRHTDYIAWVDYERERKWNARKTT